MPEQKLDPRYKTWLSRLDRCKTIRKQLIPDWQTSIDFRRGTPFKESSDQDRINVNLDWSKTKAKHANLFSQVPEVRLSPKYPEFEAAIPVFAKTLNETLRKAKVGTAVDEAVIDCINASGIGVVAVSYERRTEKRDVPTVDPQTAQQMTQAGIPVPTESIDVTTDAKFCNRRISPADLLWPVEFTGSGFDDAPWIGRSGVMTWAQAKNEFDLKDSDKERVIGATRNAYDETLRDEDETRTDDDESVEFDEIFYWADRDDPDVKYFEWIKRLVFVNGIEKPVIDGDWDGQKFDEQTRSYIGATKFPIRVLTLTYISDDPIPPSDTAIGRPQVLELIKSRSQMILQRERSIPIRGFDVNRLDPDTQANLLNGTWQNWIPVNGNGQSAIWEVARASYPREDLEFDRVAKQDLDEVWQTGTNQAGAFASGERSASEARIVQQNFQTRVNYERARVADFFLGIAEVQAGLLALYGDFELNLNPRMQGWDRSRIGNEFAYTILPDSTVILDSNQRIERLMGVLNMTGASGMINPQPIIKEIVELAGLDPALILKQPQPAAPEPLNISIRNREDLADPLMLALLMKTGQAPSPEEVEAAKKLLAASQAPLNLEELRSNGVPQGLSGATLDGVTGNGITNDAIPNLDDIERPEWNTVRKISKRQDYD